MPSPTQFGSYLIVGIIIVFGVSYGIYVRQRRQTAGVGDQGLERRVEDLTANLRQAASVVGEIEQEVRARQELLEQLKEDSQQAEELSKLRATEVEAVAQALRGQLSILERRSLKGNIVLGLIFYILGIASSILVNIFVP